MEQKQYVQARLSLDTHTRLTAFLERLKVKAKAKPSRYRPALCRGKAGLSDAIDELLFYFDQEETRKRSWSASRSKNGRKTAEKINPAEVLRMIDEGCPQAG
jgi:hypothetical protein